VQHLPNILTIFRIAMIPALYLAFFIDGPIGDWLCVVIFTLACTTDFFDGWVARRYNVQSGFGRMLDPIADKLTVATCLMLLVHGRMIADIHLLAAVIILCREILVSGLREYLMELRVSLPVNFGQIQNHAANGGARVFVVRRSGQRRLGHLARDWLGAFMDCRRANHDHRI